jgi:glycosyltransferase involved in cell wall biosynthesis
MQVTVLTRADNQPQIESYLTWNAQANLTFAYVNVPSSIARPTTGLHYALWHWRAVDVATKLHRAAKFDVIHHITYTSIHVPTQLWRLGVPTIFGPVGGGQTTPPAMLTYFGSSARKEKLRTLVTRALLLSPLHRRWLKKMSVVFAANSDTLMLIQKLGRSDVRLQFDNGIASDYLLDEPREFTPREGPTRLLWVGRMLPRKALPMALDALARTRRDATLTIVGNGLDAEVVQNMIAERGLSDRVNWAGRRLTMEEVRAAYIEHDALLFTSVRETSGVQLLEAMALGLPIICLDLHGAHDVVPDAAGFKIAVTTPLEVIEGLAKAIDRFYEMNCGEKDAMALASWRFARNNTWPMRAEAAERVYEEVLAKHP